MLGDTVDRCWGGQSRAPLAACRGPSVGGWPVARPAYAQSTFRAFAPRAAVSPRAHPTRAWEAGPV